MSLCCLWNKKRQVCKNGEYPPANWKWKKKNKKKVKKLVSPSEGAGVFDSVFGGALARRRPTLTDKIAEGAAMFVNPTASWPAAFMKLGSQGLKGVTDNIRHYRGGAVDIHKQIGKLPKPKGGWTLPGHKYTGPYNDLENQVRYDPETGKILEIYDQPTGPTDAVAMQHNVDYSVCGDDRKCKNKADKKMVKSLDAIPWKERQWGHTLARTIINTKQKLGMGTKNVKRR